MLRNFFDSTERYQNPESIESRVSILCKRLGFKRERVIGWGLSQAVLADIWSVEEGKVPGCFVKTAEVLRDNFLFNLFR